MVANAFRGLPRPKKLLPLIIQLCSCRRTMVINIWCRKISRVWLQTNVNTPHPRVLTEPRCRTYATMWYLIYRWIMSIFWLAIMICSIWEFGGIDVEHNNRTWPIYLTNWDLVLGAVQSLLGAYLVTKRWLLQKNANDINACNTTYCKLGKLYWILYTITCTLAVGVTVSYWAAVYDPTVHHIDPLNIMIHVCNSFLMLADICIVNIPLHFRNFWWCLVLIIFYLTFSLIYFAAGGLDKHGLHYIYKVLDWKKPGITLLIALGGITFLVIVHCTLCYITNLLSRAFDNGAKYMEEPPASSSNEQTQKPKDLEIV